MQAGYRIETRRWQADLGALPDLGGLNEDVAAAALFAHGLAALRSGDAGGARRDLAAIDQRLGTTAGATPAAAASHQGHGGGAAAAPSQARRSAAVMRAELAALLSLEDAGRGAAGAAARQASVAVLERAAADEDATSYEFGPPVVVKPAHELAGEALLDLGRPAEARRHFAAALVRAPRRSLALLGLARAAARDGDAAAAAAAYADLRSSWRHADADLPERTEVTEARDRTAR
jgi:tetratricopeptide (TPR) repeat protein